MKQKNMSHKILHFCISIFFISLFSIMLGSVYATGNTTQTTPIDDPGKTERNLKSYFLQAHDTSLEDATIYANIGRNLNNSNWGESPLLFISSLVGGFRNWQRRIFIKFDAEEVSRFPILLKSVKLQLYDGSNSPILKDKKVNSVNVKLYRVIDPWIEGTGGKYKKKYPETFPDAGNTLSWKNQPKYDTTKIWAETQLSPLLRGIWVEWDITELVKAWVSGKYKNRGLVLIGEGEGKKRYIHLFTSSEWPNKKFAPRFKIIKEIK